MPHSQCSVAEFRHWRPRLHQTERVLTLGLDSSGAEANQLDLSLQAVDARKAAVEEVERLLQHPEDLKRLPNMLEEYTQKHQANKAQLSATVASQVDAARAGMELLDSAQKALAKMQECYKV